MLRGHVVWARVPEGASQKGGLGGFRVDILSSTLSADHAKEDTFGNRSAQVLPIIGTDIPLVFSWGRFFVAVMPRPLARRRFKLDERPQALLRPHICTDGGLFFSRPGKSKGGWVDGWDVSTSTTYPYVFSTRA